LAPYEHERRLLVKRREGETRVWGTAVLDERLLLAQVAVGDEEAMRQFYLAYRPRLRRYLWHQLDGDPSGVEEALQDIFLAVWRAAGGYRGAARVSTWVYQIAHNVALDSRRRVTRLQKHLQLATRDDDDASEADWSVDASSDAEDVVLNRLTVADAMRRLSAKHREVLALIFQHGFSLDEAAQILNVPIGTVKSRINYARKALLRELSAASAEEARRDP
jgi:RNA polymerase sigma-70 factor (ECF subfamily)